MNAARKALAAAVVLAELMPWARAENQDRAKVVPGFSIVDMQGHLQNYPSTTGAITVVMFFSTRCPLSNAFNYRRNLLYRAYENRVRFVAIDSNFNESLDEERAYANDVGFGFPVFRDVDNRVADLLGARNTTENFVLDATGTVRYRGYIEDAPNPARTTRQGLRLAIDAVLAGQPVATPETRGIGCAIRRFHPPVDGAAEHLNGGAAPPLH
jgi:thiol-disulfide isomerase/thioredoxin